MRAIRDFETYTPHDRGHSPDTVTVGVRFNPPSPARGQRWDREVRDAQRLRIGLPPPGPDEPVYGVEFTYRLTPGGDVEPHPIAAQVLDPDGFKPSELSKSFAWARWERIAQAYARLGRSWSHERRSDLREAVIATQGTLGIRPKRRPGRAGHPPQHYTDIADAYLRHMTDGHRNPVERIADEWGVGGPTASGWVRETRRRGLLPSPRRREPG